MKSSWVPTKFKGKDAAAPLGTKESYDFIESESNHTQYITVPPVCKAKTVAHLEEVNLMILFSLSSKEWKVGHNDNIIQWFKRFNGQKWYGNNKNMWTSQWKTLLK